MKTLRKQWDTKEILKLERIREDDSLYLPLLRYASSEQDIPAFVSILTTLYPLATSDTCLVFMHVLMAALEVLKRSHLRAVASKVSRTIIKEHLKLFYRVLSSNHNPIVSPALDLLTTIASVDGSVNELLFNTFDFSLKALPKFAFMRKKTLAQDERKDIRSAYICFLLSFLQHGNSATKQALSKMQNLIGPVFAGLPDDSFSTIDLILKCIEKHIIYEEKKSKSLLISFLYASSLSKIAKLYESADEMLGIRVDDFLRLICTNTERGICFKSTTDLLETKKTIKNRVILDFLVSINPLESLRKQQLCVDILNSCEDIFGAYWSKSSFSFEPEFSVRYVNLASFTVKALKSSPPACSDVDDLIPKSIQLNSLIRGLGHSNKMVVYFTSHLILSILERAERFLSNFEFQTCLLTDEHARTIALSKRNAILSGLSARLPSGKIMYQIYQSLVKNTVTNSTSLIVENLLNSLRIACKVFRMDLNFGHSLVRIGKDNAVPAFPLDSTSKLYWRYVAESVPFNYNQSDFDYIRTQISTIPISLQRSLLFNMVSSSGYASHNELVFLRTVICGASDITSMFEKVSSCLVQLGNHRFVENGSLPFIKALALMQDYDNFNMSLNTRSLTIGLDIDQDAIGEDISEDFSSCPILSSTSDSGMVEEILSLIKHTQIQTSIPKIGSFSIVHDDSNQNLTCHLLSKFDMSTWLQFLARLFNSKLSDTVDIRTIIECGALSFPLFGLSSTDDKIWRASHFVLKSFYGKLLTATFRERREILLLFEYLKNSLTDTIRLPSVHASFLCEAIQVLLRPAHFMYARLMELLLANHSMDLLRIPLFMECLNTSSETLNRDQVWMLRIVISGMRTSQDYQEVYQFNHVLETVETLLMLPRLDHEVERQCHRILEEFGRSNDHAFIESIQTWKQCMNNRTIGL